MADKHLHLLVPGLLVMEPALLPSSLNTPALAQLLSRATCSEPGDSDADTALLRLFDVAGAPFAALYYLAATGSPPPQPCALVSAIHLDVGRAGLVLDRILDGSLSDDDWRALAGELEQVLQARGLRWDRQGAQGFVLMAEAMAMPAQSPSALRGSVIDHALSREQGLALHALLNEMQMQLHHGDFNRRRVAAGRTAVSSLWLWGAGPLPTPPRHWRRVGADTPLARGLALAAGVTPEPAEVLARWLAADCDGPCLLYRDDFLRLPAGDPAPWLDLFLDFEQSCWAPLFAALRAGKVERLDISDPQRGLQFTIGTRAARRWTLRRPAQAVVTHRLGPPHPMST